MARLRKGRKARRAFVESHIAKTIAFQVRAFRDKVGWSQKQLGAALTTSQNAIYRLEAGLARPTLTTLQGIAAKMDVALIVRFVPHSELIDWVSGTPRVERGLSAATFEVPSFAEEFSDSAAEMGRESAETWSLWDVPVRMVKATAVEVKVSNTGGVQVETQGSDDRAMQSSATTSATTSTTDTLRAAAAH